MIFLNENYVPCNLSRSVTLKRPGFNSTNELKNYVKLKFKKKNRQTYQFDHFIGRFSRTTIPIGEQTGGTHQF